MATEQDQEVLGREQVEQQDTAQDTQCQDIDEGLATAEAGAEAMDEDTGVAVEAFGAEDITQNYIMNQHHTIPHTRNKYHLTPVETKKKPTLRKNATLPYST